MYHELNNQLVIVKKNRKKIKISMKERCKAIINNGKQCSRRKKYNEFCGKHKDKQHFGIITNNTSITNYNFIIDPKQNDKNYIEVKKFQYNNK